MRETRSYGSVRGVRSNLYPYRDRSHFVSESPPKAGQLVRQFAQGGSPLGHEIACFLSVHTFVLGWRRG